MSNLPLKGYRIISAEQYGAGPYGTMFLAQMGAEVIKIEPPKGGDTARMVGPHFLRENESLYFQTFNYNKKSITLDITKPEGKEILHELVNTSDAVANNLRGDLAQKLGLDYLSLGKINPKIVCAHLTAYGRDNRRKSWPGYDYLMQAEAGYCYLTGNPDSEPTRFGLSMVDFITGTIMTIGLLGALLDAQRTSKGRDVDTDLFSSALHQTSYPALWYMNENDETKRTPRSAHPSVTPSQIFKASDGYLFVMAQLPRFWGILTNEIGQAKLAQDERFSTPEARLKNRLELTEILDATFAKNTVAYWCELLAGKMPVAPVYDLKRALDNPFAQEIGMIDTIFHIDKPDLKVLNCPIKFDGERLKNKAAPLLGEDTEEIMVSIGKSEAQITKLRHDGII